MSPASATLPEQLEQSVTRLAHVLLRGGGSGLSRTAASVLHRLASAGPQRVTGLAAYESIAHPAATAFPDPVDAALRVGHLGKSSVRYEIGLFGEGGGLAAEGWFVHVFVDRGTRRPVEIPAGLRAALERLG